jgi:hypothetical protein
MSEDVKQLVKRISYMSTFDGGLYIAKKCKNACFVLNMRAENMDYILHVKRTMENITGATIYDRKDYNVDGYIRSPQVRLETRAHPFLTKIHERLYIDGHKVIDPHMLTLMDAEALAIIFMCDGGTKLDLRFKRPHATITLNTKGFSYADNMYLSKAIFEKTGVYSNVNRQNSYFYLNIPVKSHALFIDTVTPFMFPSFTYKLERIAPALKKEVFSPIKAMGDDIV